MISISNADVVNRGRAFQAQGLFVWLGGWNPPPRLWKHPRQLIRGGEITRGDHFTVEREVSFSLDGFDHLAIGLPVQSAELDWLSEARTG